MSHLTEKKLSEMRSFDKQQRRPQNCLSSRLSHTELRSSLRESQSFLSLPADTTMASSQGTSVSSNSFNTWASHGIFLFKYHFLFHTLRFLFSFTDNIMADVASKQQTTALFSSTIVTRPKRHTELTKKKPDKPDGKPVLYQRTLSSVFCSFFCTVKLHSLTYQTTRNSLLYAAYKILQFDI